ncbi:uncharacterized protein LOC111398355 [Olea europaea var. sylvestris]|uniref:uncharacterized protein LOC111398355 n=1 Tax=Olea europaea var. sylvestris TaxID=158386 RepID=UPI000C1D617C|nr:uncharacterized protein LOC111398355 [Olea europaea var. sylvestris]
MEAMSGNGQMCYQEFQMYPPMLRHFAHLLRDKYSITRSQQVDIYEKVGMFLCILAHGKGYRQDCIGVIDGTHVRAVLPRHERVHFIGRKGIPTQNVLVACDFNLCFTFVLAGYIGNTHDARILACAIYSPEIEFPQPATGKYYLVDSDFAHRPGYMAPYKGQRRRFRNTREKFNFRHSSCKNVIERAFGVLKQRWKIFDRLPSYSFPTQVAVVLATMAVHNFLRRSGVVDEAFARAKTDDDVAEVELPNAEDEIQVEVNAPEIQRNEWDRLRDYMTQQS